MLLIAAVLPARSVSIWHMAWQKIAALNLVKGGRRKERKGRKGGGGVAGKRKIKRTMEGIERTVRD